ncbi:hypothetical protein NC651_002800 [Populus alba x Populus x berolinensis]|nr:hypothetical protein NC651_002800 [Populus alba x Populus x berolinensis]
MFSTPSSLLPLNPIARPCNNTNPFSQSSPRVTNNVPPFSRNGGRDGGDCSNSRVGFPGEYPLDDYLLFLDDPSSKNKGFMDQKVQLGGYPVANGDRHLHRRRFSESDVCFGAQDGGGGVLVGSPREMEEHYLQQQEEMTIMNAAQQHQQQRLAYFKYMNFSLQPQNKTEWCIQDY